MSFPLRATARAVWAGCGPHIFDVAEGVVDAHNILPTLTCGAAHEAADAAKAGDPHFHHVDCGVARRAYAWRGGRAKGSDLALRFCEIFWFF